MIDPVTPAAATTPAAGRMEAAAPRPRGEPEAAAPTAPREPLSLDVEQGADGVFVYTLSDPGTGAILAVIPRQDVRLGRHGQRLDQRV